MLWGSELVLVGGAHQLQAVEAVEAVEAHQLQAVEAVEAHQFRASRIPGERTASMVASIRTAAMLLGQSAEDLIAFCWESSGGDQLRYEDLLQEPLEAAELVLDEYIAHGPDYGG